MYTHQSCTRRKVAGKRRFRHDRCGTAIVEFAISLPIVFILVFGGIEIANAIFLQQFVTEASYHGTLDALKPGSLEANVITGINDVLQTRGVVNADIEIKGTDGSAFDSLAPGSPFYVQVSLDHGENYSGPIVQQFFDLTAKSVTLRQ